MSRFDEYMNDPDIVNEPMPLREIHAIRLMIYDEIKDMTLEERSDYWKKKTDGIMKRYGIEHLAAEKAAL